MFLLHHRGFRKTPSKTISMLCSAKQPSAFDEVAKHRSYSPHSERVSVVHNHWIGQNKINMIQARSVKAVLHGMKREWHMIGPKHPKDDMRKVTY